MSKKWIGHICCIMLLFSSLQADEVDEAEIAAFNIESVIASKSAQINKESGPLPGIAASESAQVAQEKGRKVVITMLLMAGLIALAVVTMSAKTSSSNGS